MPYSNHAKNAMLDAIGITHASLHDGFPGNTGANELTGGSPAYARKAISYGAASNGARSQSNQPQFDVPAGKTLRWVGYWDAVSAGNFKGYAPVGGQSAKEYTVAVATDTINLPGHGYADGDKVVFVGGTPPGGITEGTEYFVVSSAADSFKVSATSGGAAIDLTSVGDTSVVVHKIITETFGSQGTYTLQSGSLGLNL